MPTAGFVMFCLKVGHTPNHPQSMIWRGRLYIRTMVSYTLYVSTLIKNWVEGIPQFFVANPAGKSHWKWGKMRENHLMSPLNRASVGMCWPSPQRCQQCQPMVFYRVCCDKIPSLCCLTIIPHHPTHVLLPKSKRRPAMGNTFVVWLKLWYPNTTD